MSGSSEPSTTKKAKESEKEKVSMNAELEWIRFREETLGPAAYSETASEKMWRKITANPLVPVGALATFCALTYGLWCFRSGRMRDSQMMMRARIGAQGFTIIALLGGIAFGVGAKPNSLPAVTVEATEKPKVK